MKSFVFAFRGIARTIRNERNMRIHLCFTLYVILAGAVTRITVSEWTAVLICIGMVTALECINTSVENLCDTVSPEKSEGIRITKDAAAGAVLCAAVFSAVVGSIVFFNEKRIEAAVGFLREHTALSILIILTLIPSGMFVKGRKRERI